VLHGRGIVTRAAAKLPIEFVGLVNALHVGHHAKAGAVRNGDRAIGNTQRLAGEALSVLPYPMRIDGGDIAGGGGATWVNMASEMSK
jgi:hypothetical protein